MSLVLMIGVIFLVVALGSWFAVGKLIDRLLSHNIVDRPNERTLHHGAVPRGGGLVIVACLLLVLVLMALVSSRPQIFSCMAVLILSWAGLSWWDDKVNLSARFRFLVQLGLSLLTVLAFGWVSQVLGLNLFWFGPLASVIGLLWMANLYNFMDGLDGLAASQTIIGGISLAFWFYVLGDKPLAVACVVLAASCYGFLMWNWSPAKIFMGDVGSISIGAFFGTLFIIGVTRYDLSIISFLGLFGVFIADATITLMVRAWRREKIWLPHRQHFYQRLANAGYSHSRIALGGVMLMSICSVFATLGVMSRDMILSSLIAILLVLAATAVLVVFLENRSKA